MQWLSEVTHIRIQRFHTGDGEHDRPQRHEGNYFVFKEEMHGPVWVQRMQHFRVRDNAA